MAKLYLKETEICQLAEVAGMQEYVKPNMILPISLHDARLSSIRVESDMIIFVMEDGIRTI